MPFIYLRNIVVCVWCHISSKYTNTRARFEDKQTVISSSNHEVPERSRENVPLLLHVMKLYKIMTSERHHVSHTNVFRWLHQPDSLICPLCLSSVMIGASKALMFIDIFLIPVITKERLRLCQSNNWTCN